MSMENMWNDDWQWEAQVFKEKSDKVPLCLPQILPGLTWY